MGLVEYAYFTHSPIGGKMEQIRNILRDGNVGASICTYKLQHMVDRGNTRNYSRRMPDDYMEIKGDKQHLL